jgi:hypothetical protein
MNDGWPDAPLGHWQPEASESPEDTARLLEAIVGLVDRFVVLPLAQAVAVALWVLHTWAFDAADATPYLLISSAEKRSGKTRLLELLELLVARPWLTGRVSAAVLARKVDAERPTLLLDETDAAFKSGAEYAEALRGILNTGHRHGGKTSLCVRQGSDFTFRDFSTFAPKALAGIGDALPDTVADRSIPVRLQRKAPNEHTGRFRRAQVEAEVAPLRERFDRWAAANVEALAAAEPALPEALDDRAQDGWEPLFAIADVAGDGWPERARRAALELSGGEEHEDDSIGVRLLADLRDVFEARQADRLGSAEIVADLVAIEESPWGDLRGKPVDGRRLAALLRPYRIKPKALRIGDKTPRGYEREQFQDSWNRYLPPRDRNTRNNGSTMRDSDDPESATGGPVLHTKYRDSWLNQADVADVALPAGAEGDEQGFGAATDEDEAELARLEAKFPGDFGQRVEATAGQRHPGPLLPGDPGFEGLARRRCLEGHLIPAEKDALVAWHRALREVDRSRQEERPPTEALRAELAAALALLAEVA